MSDDIIDDNVTLDDSIDSLKTIFDECYRNLSVSSSVMTDLANTLDKMYSDKKLVEDKILQITGEIKEIGTDIDIECVEDAERMNELTGAIARNESKKVIINGLNKLIDKYNVDIELLLLNNYRHYSDWKGKRGDALNIYNRYRTMQLARDIQLAIDDVFCKNGVYPYIDCDEVNNIIAGYISSSMCEIRHADSGLRNIPDAEFNLMFDSVISDMVNELPGINGADNHIVRQQRIAELTRQKESL
ncbi:hypothetical protein [Enterobacter sp. PTB]|uniref:hypothetical protein n=1 Tax=Enterobacter sp. PTB TaxID=3143437 RepID=UPI003DA8E82A